MLRMFGVRFSAFKSRSRAAASSAGSYPVRRGFESHLRKSSYLVDALSAVKGHQVHAQYRCGGAMKRILVALELARNGFRHPWRLAKKLIRSLKETDGFIDRGTWQ